MKTNQLTLIITLFFTLYSMAQTHTWTGNGGDNFWNNPDNWDVFTVPNATSDVLISGQGIMVDVQGANDGATIVIEQGATLTVHNTLAIGTATTIDQGTIEILNGGLYSNPGGVITIQPNARLIVAGDLNITDAQTLLIGNASELEITTGGAVNNNGGTITIQPNAKLIAAGDISNNNGVITIGNTSEMDYSLGAITGGTINNLGNLNISGVLDKEWHNITIQNENTITVTDAGIIRLFDNTIINNAENALFEIVGSGSFTTQSGTPVFNNIGLFKKSTNGSPSSGYIILELNNDGVIDVGENETLLFLTPQAILNNNDDGILQGSGTFDITGTFNNTGTISPGGFNIGTLHFLNTFSMNDGTIILDLVSESEHDRIEVFGSAEMTGEFEVFYNVADVGTEFTVITTTNPITTCDFPAEFSLSDGKEKMIFETSCEKSSVVVTYVGRNILDVDDFKTNLPIVVAPNPTTPSTTITIPPNFFGNTTTLEIVDITGKIVFAEMIKSTTIPLNTNGLTNGLYFVRITNENSFISTKILVGR